MTFTKERMLKHLQEHQISYQLYEHEPAFTCTQAYEIIKRLNMPGTGIKNLFLKDDYKKLYLISATDSTKINLRLTSKILKTKGLRFANEELMMQYLKVTPGSVTPLALVHDINHEIQVILDANISKQKYIQIHPLQNDASVVLTPTDLIRFLSLHNKTFIQYDFEQNLCI